MGGIQSRLKLKDLKDNAGQKSLPSRANNAASSYSSSEAPSSAKSIKRPPHNSMPRPSVPRREPIPSIYQLGSTSSPDLVLNANKRKNSSSYVGVESNSRFLPKDWDSEDHDLAQHFALRQLFGSNVAQVVAPKFAPHTRAVDLGCANGAWVMDMATQYPDCQFTGIDFGAMGIHHHISTLPLSNLTFETVEDVSHLPLQDASVDVVHMRAMNFYFQSTDWNNVLKEVYRILKPGGMLQIVELHIPLAGTVMIESFIDTIRKVLKSQDKDYDMALKISGVLESAGFEVIQSQMKKVHFASDGKIGQDFVAVILRSFESFQSILAPCMGLDVDDYRQRVETVCAQCVLHNAHLAWYTYVGKKRMSA